jgi:hypothetical protein
MKLPIAVFALVVALIAGFGWHHHQQLAAARTVQIQLENELAKFDTGADPSIVASKAAVRRSRDPVAVGGKILADESVAAIMDSGPSDPSAGIRLAKTVERIALLPASQLAEWAAAIARNEAIDLPQRRRIIEQMVLQLGDDHPQAALELSLQSREFFKGDPDGTFGNATAAALLSWGKTDFAAALEWLRRNSTDDEPLVESDGRAELLGCYDGRNYNEAFKLITELQIDPYSGTQSLMGIAKTPEERVAVIEALRAYLPTISSENQRRQAADYAFAAMGSHLVIDGFDAATRWVESAKLTPVEIASFGKDFGSKIKPGEQALWLGWLGEKVPPNRLKRPVTNVVDEWTKIDHQAVGNWLVGAPAGPVKDLAVQVFAADVAAYEPEAAVKWALTLPAGKDRQACLTKIYCNLPQETPAGKAAAVEFAKKYAIE